MYRKQGNLDYRSSLTPQPIELILCMSDYVAHRTPHAQQSNQGFRRVSTTQGVKCNPHGIDIPFFGFFVISVPHVQTRVFRASPQFFFTKRRRSAVIAFLEGFPPNILNSYPQNPHFRRPINAKPLIGRALRQSRVNGATKLKIYNYNYIDIGKYLCACQNVSARGPPGAQGPLM